MIARRIGTSISHYTKRHSQHRHGELGALLMAACAFAVGSLVADRLSRRADLRRKRERQEMARWEDEGGAIR